MQSTSIWEKISFYNHVTGRHSTITIRTNNNNHLSIEARLVERSHCLPPTSRRSDIAVDELLTFQNTTGGRDYARCFLDFDSTLP